MCSGVESHVFFLFSNHFIKFIRTHTVSPSKPHNIFLLIPSPFHGLDEGRVTTSIALTPDQSPLMEVKGEGHVFSGFWRDDQNAQDRKGRGS